MNPIQKSAFESEIAQARALIAAGNVEKAFSHLERAHILGQRFVFAHVLSHWLMLRVEIRRKKRSAAFGQVMRIVMGAIGSALGVVPTGNSGGSNISMFKRMPIEPELKNIIEGRGSGNSPGLRL
jgi:hypothetical protein